jgi:biotin operon repressor
VQTRCGKYFTLAVAKNKERMKAEVCSYSTDCQVMQKKLTDSLQMFKPSSTKSIQQLEKSKV